VNWLGGKDPVGRKVGRVPSNCNLLVERRVQRATHLTMNSKDHNFQLRIDQIERLLKFTYTTGTNDALFDICDNSGRILKTGAVNSPETSVGLSGLGNDEYYLMVLDGEVGRVEPFRIS